VKRRRLATTGERGQLVRLFETTRRGVRRYVVQWGAKQDRHQESFAGTREGKAEAEAFYKAFKAEAEKGASSPASPLTVRQLWMRFLESESGTLRPNTRRLYAEAWRHWENFITPEAIAQDMTVPTIGLFRAALDSAGLATATVQRTITVCRVVYAWAERIELIERNRWHLYRHKIAKDRRTPQRAEFRRDEFLALWRAFDPALPGQWRAFVLTGLLGIYGSRQTELLAGLQWPNIGEDVAVIPGAYVKTGDEARLPLFPLTRALLAIARAWAEKDGYTGPQVFYPGSRVGTGRANASKTPHYTIQSYTAALDDAHARAGVPKIRYRAGHGFRRGLVGDLADASGDIHAALLAIGDHDVRMARNYRVRRDDKTRQLLGDRLDGMSQHIPKELRSATEGATEVQPSPSNVDVAPSEAAPNAR
jgi:hypothetical protein